MSHYRTVFQQLQGFLPSLPVLTVFAVSFRYAGGERTVFYVNRAFLLIVLFFLFLSPSTRADWEPGTDYMARMLAAAEAGDAEAGRAAEAARADKLAALELDYPEVRFDELLLLAQLIQAEAGSDWLDLRWKMAVGEVALNRVESPEFPDTLAEVAAQPGQYCRALERYRPSRESVEAARRLLEGERVLGDASVVFQSNYVLGGGVCLTLRDARLGPTYLCFSTHPELYR